MDRGYKLTKEAVEYVEQTGYFKDRKRIQTMCEMRLQGSTYSDIGKAFNLTSNRCQQICDRVARIYASAARTGAIKQKVNWRWDWGVYVPFCPYCDEPAYEQDHCVFCNREYEWVEGKHKATIVNVGEYTVVQCTNNHIHIYKDGRMVMHASCTKKKTEDELKEMVSAYEMLCKNPIPSEEGEENEQK